MLEEFLKIALSMLLLVFIYVLKEYNHTYTLNIFKDKRWDLLSAYKIFVPIQILFFLLDTPIIRKMYLNTSPKIALLIISFIPTVLILLLFIYIVKRPFQVQWSDLGINLESLIKKAVPILFLIIMIFIFYIYEKHIESKIVSHFSVFKLLILFSVILASIAEELLFRGVMWGAFITKMNLPMAALASSVCWSLWHYDSPILVNIGIVMIGLFLSWTYYKSKTILVPMAIHSATNIVKYIVYW